MATRPESVAARRSSGWSLLPAGASPGWLVASWAVLWLVIWGSLRPGEPYLPISELDKLQHFSAYFALSTWFNAFYPRDRHHIVASWLLVLGFTMEALQGWMHMYRTTDWLDMLANSVGVGLGCLLVPYTSNWPRLFERWLGRR